MGGRGRGKFFFTFFCLLVFWILKPPRQTQTFLKGNGLFFPFYKKFPELGFFFFLGNNPFRGNQKKGGEGGGPNWVGGENQKFAPKKTRGGGGGGTNLLSRGGIKKFRHFLFGKRGTRFGKQGSRF